MGKRFYPTIRHPEVAPGCKATPSRTYSQVAQEPRLEPVDPEALRLVLSALLELWQESQRRERGDLEGAGGTGVPPPAGGP